MPLSPLQEGQARADHARAIPRQVMVWDPVVRLFHWAMVGGFLLNMTVLADGKSAHRTIGYAIAALIAIRIVWGFVGSAHARFSDFVPDRRDLLDYLRRLARGREPRYVGHNPAGAVSMAVLVGLMLLCCLTGWMTRWDMFWGAEWLEEGHEAVANLIVAAAGLHVLAALVEGARHGENLVKAMVTGRKRPASGTDVDHANPAGRG